MRKQDIARHIRQHVGISEYEADQLLDRIHGLLKTTLQTGEPITIQGFGRFAVRNKLARPGRNLQTGEAMTISARRVVTFRPSLRLRTEVTSVPGKRHVAVMRMREEWLLPKEKA